MNAPRIIAILTVASFFLSTLFPILARTAAAIILAVVDLLAVTGAGSLINPFIERAFLKPPQVVVQRLQ